MFVTGTSTEVGKTVVAAVIARTLAAEGKTVAVFKPAVTGLDEDGEPDHALLRRAAGSIQADEEIAPYRYGPPASPHLAAALAGEEIDPERLRAAAHTAAVDADVVVCEGVGGCSSRCAATTWSATSPSTWACRSRSPHPRAWGRSTTHC